MQYTKSALPDETPIFNNNFTCNNDFNNITTLFIVKIESAYIVRDSLVQFNRKLIKTCPAGNVTMNVITNKLLN
jgi:hypothetical protein